MDNTGMLLFPGDVLSKLKLAPVGYTLYLSKGSDGPLHGQLVTPPRIHVFLDSSP